MVEKRKSVDPLDGGYGNYISTLDEIRKHVDQTSMLTEDDLKHWYWENHPNWRARQGASPRAVNAGGRFDDTTKAYINFLFRCGLLEQAENGPKGIRCSFPMGKNKSKKIIEKIDSTHVFILDMLKEAKEWIAEDDLIGIAREKYNLSLSINQIRFRRGWLQSAGMVDARGNDLRTTHDGMQLLGDGFNPPPLARQSTTGLGSGGEGDEHKAMKQFVCENCDEILGEHVSDRRVEHELPSGDSVDVTAWNRSSVWHIEVKSRISNDSDIRRGIYQCVKYEAVGRAVESVKRRRPRKIKALLVVERDLPDQLVKLARVLKVDFRVVSHRGV